MSSAPQHAAWTSTYRLSSATRQQRILRAIHRLDNPGIKALGTTEDSDSMIVIECASAASEVLSRKVVMAVDPSAVRTETTRAAGVGYDNETPGAAHLSVRATPRRLIGRLPTERLKRLL